MAGLVLDSNKVLKLVILGWHVVYIK